MGLGNLGQGLGRRRVFPVTLRRLASWPALVRATLPNFFASGQLALARNVVAQVRGTQRATDHRELRADDVWEPC